MIKFWKLDKIKELEEIEKEINELLKTYEVVEISRKELRSMPLTSIYKDYDERRYKRLILKEFHEGDYEFIDEWISKTLNSLWRFHIQPRMDKADELRRELNIR